jgi:hypothetical protein
MFGRIFNPNESQEVRTRKKSFTLMKVFYQLGAYNAELFERPYEDAVRRGVTQDPVDVKSISGQLASKDEQEAFLYLHEHPGLASAVDGFTRRVAERLSNPPYTQYWAMMAQIAEAVNRYTGKTDRDETGHYMYMFMYPGVLKEAREMWKGVPDEVKGDMVTLLKKAYSEDIEYLDGVLEDLDRQNQSFLY